MTHLLHGMEIVKAKKEHTKNSYPHTITNELFFARNINKQNSMPKDILVYILHYSIALKNRDFQNSTDPLVAAWNDFQIPTSYYHVLKPKQKALLIELLTSTPLKNYDVISHRTYRSYQPKLYLTLKSKKDYALFLTLPIEVRRCLRLLPLSERQLLAHEGIAIISINHKLTIQVKNKSAKISNEAGGRFCGYKPKLIVPEDQHHWKK